MVIQSEDGMIDIVPNLRPQISRREIKLKIEQLERLAAIEEPDTVEFNRLMRWLDDRRFYMTNKSCKRIESSREAVEPRFASETFRIIIPKFKRHSELNKSYFLD